jgi:adenine-specific DNA-methyltransferase
MTMQKLTATYPETLSTDPTADNFGRLRALFPELVTECPDGAAVNVDVLKALVGDRTVTDAAEKYGLNWHGKRRARQIALTASIGTLRPCIEGSVDWHTTQNLMIEGDNLEVLKLLQKSYAGKVKLIYIDPPYNTGKDFVYQDSFKDNIRNYLELTGQVEGGAKVSSNTEASGRFHTDWLNMMYPRLKLARTLLAQDGAIFISISDVELPSLRHVCDEVFGEENFLANLVWRSGGTASSHFTAEHEYILAYARRIDALPLFSFTGDATVSDRAIKRPSAKNPMSVIRFPAGLDFESPDRTFPTEFGDSEPVKIVSGVLAAKNGKLENDVEIEAAWAMGDMIRRWLEGEVVTDQKGQRISRFFFKGNGVLQYEKEKSTVHPKTIIEGITTKAGSQELASLVGTRLFDYPKPTELVRGIVEWVTHPGSLVLDFFAGSGTTGHAVMAQNAKDGGDRRWILVQLPERIRDATETTGFDTVADITRERLREAGSNMSPSVNDIGFRVFKLDSSNIRAWDPDRDDLDRTLLESVDHLKPDRTEADVLYELLLKLGLDLCVPIEKRSIAGKDVHAVGGGVLMACLAKRIERSDVEALAQGIVDWNNELAPARDNTCVFRDSAFADDVAKTNMAAILEQHGIDNVRSL